MEALRATARTCTRWESSARRSTRDAADARFDDGTSSLGDARDRAELDGESGPSDLSGSSGPIGSSGAASGW